MNFIRSLVVAITCFHLGSAAWAATHQPEVAASTGKAASSSAAAKESMAMMDAQMKAMREMREKMMNAKTPEERQALMGEHMKAIQGGMAMMGGMAGAGKEAMQGGMPADMATRQQMMEKRMEMMETTMRMMLDRMPAAPAK